MPDGTIQEIFRKRETVIKGETMQKKCRCCGNLIDGKPILEYHDMPGVAQNFPDRYSLERDQGIQLKIYQCQNCGLIQLLDDPVSYYRDVIRASAVSEEMKAFRSVYFKDFVDKYHLNGKKVVEIGTGKGEFLSLMRLAGVQAFGIEHCKESVAECNKSGLNVFEGYLEQADYEIPQAPFDGFFIMNFLEHIPEPNVFLQGICNNLAENAAGLVEVPNTDMILNNLLFSEFMLDHLMYFTKDTLTHLLEQNGFEVLECNSVWHDYCLAAVVRKRSPMDLTGFYARQNEITRQIHEFIDSNAAHGRKTAAWGAGHQALAVMALADLKGKIEFVVDSAVFKQNRYTPGTHIPIVSPDVLSERQSEIGVVLIMAASYSDEVARIVREKYENMAVGILRDDGIEEVNRYERKDM